MKTAKNDKEAWDIQHIPDKPRGWIQWKGTDACIDIHCVCGKIPHVDGDFLYYVQCPHCKRTYFMNGHIELICVENPDGGRVTVASQDDD